MKVRLMYELINFTVHGDYEDNLVPLETGGEIPFDVKRVYYIWGTKRTAVRGRHAHRRLEQVIVCVSGSCDFILKTAIKAKTSVSSFDANDDFYARNIQMRRKRR